MRKFLQLVLMATVCLTAIAHAQFDNAAVAGTVRDDNGAVIAGAKVTITNTQTGITATTTSNAAGEYEFPSLRVGVYKLSAEKESFSTAVADNVTPTVASRLRVDLALKPGAAHEQVTVTASSPLLQTDTSERSSVVEHHQVVELPINGREYSQLMLLSPGVRTSVSYNMSGLDSSSSREGAYNINGLRSTVNNFLLDGLDNNAYGTSNQGFSNQVIQPSPDSIAQFQMVTNNSSAQYGRSAGATINVAFASGSNKIHGTAYEFLRNNVVNAIGYFKPTGGVKPKYNRNQFGGAFGGPIVANKAFYFVDYEGLRQVQAKLQYATLPYYRPDATTQMVTLPVAVFNPQTLKMIPANTPFQATSFATKVVNNLPSVSTAVNNNYSALVRFTNFSDKYDVKFDHQLNSRMSHFVRLSQRKANLVDNPTIPLPAGGDSNGHVRVLNQQLAYGFTWTQADNRLLEARFGVSRTLAGKWPLALGTSGADSWGINGLPTDSRIAGGLPSELITGYSNLGRTSTMPQWQYPTVFNPKLNYSWTLGRHSLKFGYEYQHINTEVQDVNPLYGRDAYQGQFSNPTRVSGSFASNNLYNYVDFLFGARIQYAISTFFVANLRQDGQFGYVQDDWRVNNRLTLNVGLRYEYMTPYRERGNQMTNFNPKKVAAGCTGLACMDTASDSDPYLIDPDRNNFAPRIGFAYQLDSKSALRAGYGVSYVQHTRAGGGDLLAINAPQVINYVNTEYPYMVSGGKLVSNSNYSWTQNGYSSSLTAPSQFNQQTANITYIARNFRTPYVESWYVSLQREIARDTLIDIAYVGNHGVKTELFGNLNQAHPYTTSGAIQANRPYATWGDITEAYNGGASTYNGLQLLFQQRRRGGVTLINAFTWSRTIDNGAGSLENSNGAAPSVQDIYNPKADRAESSYDSPIINTTSIVAELPFGRGRRWMHNAPGYIEQMLGGWELSATNQFNSGQPLTVTYTPSDYLVSGIAQDFRGATFYRPNLVAGASVILPSSQRTKGAYLNPNAFTIPCVISTATCTASSNGVFGNAPRSVARGPIYTSLDLAINKSFQLTESLKLQFRTEIYNALNRTNFTSPSTTYAVGSTSFGKITNNYDARQIQFGLKLAF